MVWWSGGVVVEARLGFEPAVVRIDAVRHYSE